MTRNRSATDQHILDQVCVCVCNAYAQITAKCSSENHHAYALFVHVEGGQIERACYSRGSYKIQYESESREVQTAVELYCAFATGKPLEQVTRAGLRDLAAAHGHPNLDLNAVSTSLATWGDRDPEQLRRELGDAVYCLLVGGAVPFVLFNWAALNLDVKHIIARVLGVGPRDRIRFGGADDMYKLLEAMHSQPMLSRRGRSLELGVRSLHLNTVDESSMRSAYQRDTYATLMSQAKELGFLTHFEVV